MITALHRTGNAAFHAVEGWMNRLFGNAANPLYHLGSLTFYLFWLVLVSGIYVFIFFETNLDGAYLSVESMTHAHWWHAGVMRSLHRYASDAAVITICIHMMREFSRDRYRGIRWFSWMTGVPTLWLVVALGISGYWLVWDEMAQYVALASAELIDWLPLASGAMTSNFLSGRMTDRFFTLMAFLHLVGLPVGMVFLLWTHVSRISQVAFNPPRPLMAGTLAGLLILSLIKPAVSHGPATMAGVPTVLHLDWFYLNIYPFADRFGMGWAWGITGAISLLLLALPWLPRRQEAPPPAIDLTHCDGCHQCAKDCPFGAISMGPRQDGRNFDYQPAINPTLCTACGICVGGCHYANPFRQPKATLTAGIDMPDLPVMELRRTVTTRLAALTGQPKLLLFGCAHGADVNQLTDHATAAIVLPCSGMLPPSFIEFALKQGAAGVLVAGCRENDCYYRLGNTLIGQRLARKRDPHLPKRIQADQVRRVPASPREFDQLADSCRSFRASLTTASRKITP